MGETQVVPLQKVKFMERNPNKHTPGQIVKLRKIFRRFGQQSPIKVAERGKHYVVYAGNGFLEAMKAEAENPDEIDTDPGEQYQKWASQREKTVEVKILPGEWSDDELEAYALADNLSKSGSELDDLIMVEILTNDRNEGHDLGTLGASEEELAVLLMAQETVQQESKPEETEEKRQKMVPTVQKHTQVKPVLYLPDITILERAIKLTKNLNRSAALMIICREYINNHEQDREDDNPELAEALEGDPTGLEEAEIPLDFFVDS